MDIKQVGTISKKVIDCLKLPIAVNTPILLGPTNINHMKSNHPNDYHKYGSHIQSILNNPDYIRSNPKDNSIEYVKEFKINNEYVKVAVRISNSGQWYARSLYTLNNSRVANFIKKGTLIKL